MRMILYCIVSTIANILVTSVEPIRTITISTNRFYPLHSLFIWHCKVEQGFFYIMSLKHNFQYFLFILFVQSIFMVFKILYNNDGNSMIMHLIKSSEGYLICF